MMGSEYISKTNRMCRFVCLRKSDSSQASQGLSVMKLDMASVKFYSCEAVIIDERYLICVY